MKRRGIRPGRESPDDASPSVSTELVVWNAGRGQQVSPYLGGAQDTEAQEQWLRVVRARRRRRIRAIVVAIVMSIALVISGIVYLATRPSDDEIRSQNAQRAAAVCNAHYSQTQHVKLVTKQIDLLTNGEGGWIDLDNEGVTPPVGDLDLSPADLQAGTIGKARVNLEGYVSDDVLGVRVSALLVRHVSKLVLTLFGDSSGYGWLPHAPLQAQITSTVTVRGQQFWPACWQY